MAEPFKIHISDGPCAGGWTENDGSQVHIVAPSSARFSEISARVSENTRAEQLIATAEQLIREALHVIDGPDTAVDHRDWIKAAHAYLGPGHEI